MSTLSRANHPFFRLSVLAVAMFGGGLQGLHADELAPITVQDGVIIDSPNVDVVIPALHGLWGEDGTVQGLLELAGIPYVGCGVLASAVCMDKAVANALFDAAGIPHTKWLSAYH